MTPEARLAEKKAAYSTEYFRNGIGRSWLLGRNALTEGFIAQAYEDIPKLLAALEAVLGLHSEYQDEPDEWTHCVCCSDPVAGIYFHYPCSTVTAITKALGVTS